ncbi:flagellar basal body rod protein FlgB [Dechloromonas sp. A34]|uniref:flagellar basal body rod protein FlgB n=1 Tax=Dechloromonas sp. A34 TaxID=447588 RepID=UPI0022487CD0|nr:flagellar basal body rod protein FlgB [Dechloromonas sp. A34]
MSPINGIGNVPLDGLNGTDGKKYAAQGAAQTFPDAYRVALANAPHSKEVSTAANSSSSAKVAKHIPLEGQPQKEWDENLHEVALGLRVYRQQLLASNIANADTPGYKAVDIDFQAALHSARTAAHVGSVKLSTTAEEHLSTPTPTQSPNIPLKYHVPLQASIDGNTVDMDVERTKLAENALMYQFSIDQVGKKEMLDLLNNLR